MLVVVAAACGGRDDTPTNVPSPTIRLESEETGVALAPGAIDTLTFRVVRDGGYIGPVTLSTTGIPSSVRARFVPASLANGVTSTSLVLTADTNATRFPSSPITVTAAGAGVEPVTVPFDLRVLVPGVTLFASPVSIRAGTTGTSTIVVTRFDDFTAPVTLALTGLPSGITGTFAPSSVSGTATTSTLTLNVPSTVAPGTYSGVVTATGMGLRATTSPISVTVTAAAAPSP